MFCALSQGCEVACKCGRLFLVFTQDNRWLVGADIVKRGKNGGT